MEFLNEEEFIKNQIKELERQLEETIAIEDYENASDIQKKISRLKKGKLNKDELLRLESLINIKFRDAVNEWLDDAISAEAKYGHISGWDTSKVTNMSELFLDAHTFNENINNWNVSNVTDMSGMFCEASAFNQPLDNWDVSNVTDMSHMFASASAFNQPLDNWDVSSVTDMTSMFFEATSFNQPLDNWDVSNVTNMSDMFRGARSFCQDISNWKLSRKRHAMFVGARAFNKVYDINGKVLKKISINSTQRKKILILKKLFESRDYSLFDSGIHLISYFNEMVLYEFLLDEIKISKDGNFTRSKYFSGSGPAQPFLDYILLSLINDAPTKAKIHRSIKRASIKCIYLEAQRPYHAGTGYTENCNKYSAHQLPNLAFENLEEITLDNYTNLESLKFLLNCKKLKKIVLKGCNNIKDTDLFKKQILIDLRYLTVAKLKEMAKAKGIERLSSMKKADLIAALSSYYTVKGFFMKLH